MQLYEAAGELALFGLLCCCGPRLRRRPGALLLCYLGLYALLRFVVEIFRGDSLRGFPVELATPRLAGWLGLPPAEPIFFSAGQIGSLLTAVAVAAALPGATERRERPRLDLGLAQLALGGRVDHDAAADRQLQLTAAQHGGADGDRQIEIARGAQPAGRAGVEARAEPARARR